MTTAKKPKSFSKKAGPTLRDFQEGLVHEMKQVDVPSRLRDWDFIVGKQFSTAFRLNFYKADVQRKYLDEIRRIFFVTFTFFSSKRGNQIAMEYAEKYRTDDYLVSDSFADFPVFLTALKELKKFPFLVDLAKIEWALRCLYYRDQNFQKKRRQSRVNVDWQINPNFLLLFCEWQLYNQKQGFIHSASLRLKIIKKRPQALGISRNNNNLTIWPLSRKEILFFNTQMPGTFSDLERFSSFKEGLSKVELAKVKKLLLKKKILLKLT